jgi:hypothetical protein
MPARNITLVKWHYNKPTVNVTVWVWAAITQVRATWDGVQWHDLNGNELDDIQCWRPLKD